MDEKTAFEAVLERRVPQFVSKGIGLTIGIIDRDERRTYGFGETQHHDSTPPDCRTLYEIGSVTKVFTATLLATLVVEGVLDLQQPVRDLLPEVPSFPSSITLESLATHTSGLPRLPDNFWKSLHQNRRNPYANYSENDLLDYLRNVKASQLKEMAGLIHYSNLGMGLLGFVLKKYLNMSYDESIRYWICRRLSLPDTAVTLTAEQKQRMAQGHDGSGRTTSNFDMPVLAGAGALRSNVADLCRFVEAHFSPPEAFRDIPNLTLKLLHRELAREPGLFGFLMRIKSRLPRRNIPTPNTLGIGLGWLYARLQTGGPEAWIHNGATSGYRSFVALIPESRKAIVVLNSQGPSKLDFVLPRFTVDNLGVELLQALHGNR